MSVLKTARTAWAVFRRLVASGRSRRRLAEVLRDVAPLPDGSIRVAVYFADDAVNLYQLRQWYAPLVELNKKWPVAILSRNVGGTLKLLQESPVHVQYVRLVDDLERFIDSQEVAIVLYVNQNARNFQMFRYARMFHVFINHGESDKMYMTTNQFKAYDYAFIAGDAARQRLSSKLWDYDLDTRTFSVGRPQADHLAGELPYTPDDRTVVLYSPTWEGDRPAAHYGSVVTHGEALVSALLATGRHRVIYRPHPRSGVVDPAYGAANHRIIAAIAAANTADPAAQHIYDAEGAIGWQLAAADVAITDVSAMVYDRLATGKPIIVTRPVSPLAEVDEQGYLGSAEWLLACDAPAVAAAVDRVLTSESAHSTLNYWVERHFGDTTPGAATARFEGAIETLMARWDEFDRATPVVHDPLTS
ncbi:CDP-glycerol glycerophosphotransferase family protein [soil metagenome]